MSLERSCEADVLSAKNAELERSCASSTRRTPSSSAQGAVPRAGRPRLAHRAAQPPLPRAPARRASAPSSSASRCSTSTTSRASTTTLRARRRRPGAGARRRAAARRRPPQRRRRAHGRRGVRAADAGQRRARPRRTAASARWRRSATPTGTSVAPGPARSPPASASRRSGEALGLDRSPRSPTAASTTPSAPVATASSPDSVGERQLRWVGGPQGRPRRRQFDDC